jgi:hypothetical protein
MCAVQRRCSAAPLPLAAAAASGSGGECGDAVRCEAAARRVSVVPSGVDCVSVRFPSLLQQPRSSPFLRPA